jgi:hypothetical protein
MDTRASEAFSFAITSNAVEVLRLLAPRQEQEGEGWASMLGVSSTFTKNLSAYKITMTLYRDALQCYSNSNNVRFKDRPDMKTGNTIESK